MAEKRSFIPILHASGESIPEAWENAYLTLHEKGLYHKRDDPKEDGNPNLDSTMTIEVRNPDVDPFGHKAGGSTANEDSLMDYLYEMMGAKLSNSWMGDFNDPKDTRWEYNYHASLSQWGEFLPNEQSQDSIDQLAAMVEKLSKNPSTRKAQAITWDPRRDLVTQHTPCLQRVHPLIVKDEDGNLSFDMQYTFRSRNVADASFGNMLGLYVLGCDMRDKLEEKLGVRMPMRMVDKIDSFHVNGRTVKRYNENVAMFKKRVDSGDWKELEDRTMTREEVIEGLEYYRKTVEEKTLAQTAKYFKGSDTEFDAERQRVHDIGDRIFYLLEKYSPQ